MATSSTLPPWRRHPRAPAAARRTYRHRLRQPEQWRWPACAFAQLAVWRSAGAAAPAQTPGSESTWLYGNINKYAYYFADLLVGSPTPQRVSVIIDTGSALCGFPCKECVHCGRHLDPLFDFKVSKSAQPIRCSAACDGGCQQELCAYRQSYAEGSSLTGFFFRDQAQLAEALGNNTPVTATLGCHIDERKLFYTQTVNGIMGIAPRQEKDGMPTILQELFMDKKHIASNRFSLCLAEWGGLFTVGGYHAAYHMTGSDGVTQAMQWIPMTPAGYYYVTPGKLVLGGVDIVSISTDFGDTIVDSGTTFTYFPREVHQKIVAALEAVCNTSPGCGGTQSSVEPDCWMLSNVAAGPVKFPTFQFVFSTAEGELVVPWSPQAYLYARAEPGYYCRAFADNGATQSTVLGVSWLLHKDIVFDITKELLGVVAANCPEHKRAPGEGSFEFNGQNAMDEIQWRLTPRVMLLGGLALLLGALSCVLFAYAYSLSDEKGNETEMTDRRSESADRGEADSSLLEREELEQSESPKRKKISPR